MASYRHQGAYNTAVMGEIKGVGVLEKEKGSWKVQAIDDPRNDGYYGSRRGPGAHQGDTLCSRSTHSCHEDKYER